MDAGPDVLRTPPFLHEPLGAVPTGAADLGPISPELALVDPELARRARELLPEPGEFPAARPLPAAPAAEQAAVPEASAVPEVSAEPETRRPRRRLARTVVLAAAIFAAGAASGTVLGPENSGSPGRVLELRVVATTPQPRAKRPASRKHAAVRAPKASSRKRPARDGSAPRRRPSHAQGDWASNVLGVAGTVHRTGVSLVWHPPAGSAHVIVLRAGNRGRSVVVYRGRARRLQDGSLRPCTPYRYTIVNYDAHGHRSTGVPTSLVTAGCT
jgi:hypothetical protein